MLTNDHCLILLRILELFGHLFIRKMNKKYWLGDENINHTRIIVYQGFDTSFFTCFHIWFNDQPLSINLSDLIVFNLNLICILKVFTHLTICHVLKFIVYRYQNVFIGKKVCLTKFIFRYFILLCMAKQPITLKHTQIVRYRLLMYVNNFIILYFYQIFSFNTRVNF